jgi:hypothetical protein
VETQIRRIFKDDAKMALAISQAENGTRQCDRKSKPNKNGTFDTGIFQINSIHSAKGNLVDCTDNIKVAYQIYKTSGWYPWVVYNTGAYKKFLN